MLWGGGAWASVVLSDLCTNWASTHLFHHCGSLNRIRHGRLEIKVQDFDFAAGHFVILQLILDAVAHGEGVRHENGFFDADAVGGKHDALADVDLLVVVNGGGIGNQSPDVLAGLGIRNNADGRHRP